jgi:hypothetical protein
MYNDPNQPQQPAYAQAPYGQSPYEQTQAPYGQPQSYAPPQAPYGQLQSYAPPQTPYGQQPLKKRRRWPWILAAIVGILVLVTVGGIAAIVLAVNNSPAKAVSQQYYDAIKSQDYAGAYSNLDSNIKLTFHGQTQQINQQLFTQAALGYDQVKGKVSSYSITSVNISSSTSTGNTADVTVNVTRNNKSYDVHLQLQQEGNNWKIVSFDSL